jgi:hypothetical protein
VLEHDVGALGVLNAVDLVAGHVAVPPRVGLLEAVDDLVDFYVIPRSSSPVSSWRRRFRAR